MGGQEQAGVSATAVRCIICNRIKQTLGRDVPVNLEGMRCDPSCPGYTMDPVPSSQDPLFHRGVPEPIGAVVGRSGSTLSYEPVDVIGRALIKTHFGV